MTLYRKYRPQNLSELDSTPVREKLARIMSSSYMPHAFIFTGPKGTGKTSAARIIAKILNCEKIKGKEQLVDPRSSIINHQSLSIANIEPCNSCNSCTSITVGNHFDILEIDAASNRGIDEIRDLRDKIRLAPVSGKYKVYIIDEVHMLTNEAFNALLKTLEEPPTHAVFILATTEFDKLPGTIVSRCVRIEFSKATTEEIVRSLKRVVAGEKITVSNTVLSDIAGYADGSFRDGTKMLEQLISENALADGKTASVLGKNSGDVYEFLKILKSGNTESALRYIQSLIQKGSDFKYFVSEVLDACHKLLLSGNGIDTKLVSGVKIPEFTNAEILALIKLFSRVFSELRSASRPELPVEVAVVEWCEKID
jgi:DNA polymerase III subunit gamma/tau